MRFCSFFFSFFSFHHYFFHVVSTFGYIFFGFFFLCSQLPLLKRIFSFFFSVISKFTVCTPLCHFVPLFTFIIIICKRLHAASIAFNSIRLLKRFSLFLSSSCEYIKLVNSWLTDHIAYTHASMVLGGREKERERGCNKERRLKLRGNATH